MALQAQLMRRAATDEAKLAAAKAARDAGDIRRAVAFYRNLAFKKPPTTQTKVDARKRLAELNYDINQGKVAKSFAALARARPGLPFSSRCWTRDPKFHESHAPAERRRGCAERTRR